MAYKRNVDRLPIIPADAREHDVTCHYCIVGCCYKTVMDRLPVPFIQIHPDDMAELGLKPGGMVEVFNAVGTTQALAYPEPTARRNETFMVFGAPHGAQGSVINAGTNELILPNYKQTWANIRKISDATPAAARVSFKSWEVEL